MKKLVIALMSILLSVCTAWAQERPQADVQVRSVFVVRVAPPVAADAATAGATTTGATTVPPPHSAPVRVIRGGEKPRNEILLVCEVVVYSCCDNSAGQAQLRILLPLGVHAVTMSPGCIASITIPFDGSQGFVTCELGDIAVGASKQIRVFTTLPLYPGVHNTFGAFAWSNTPDPDPHNNYGEGTRP